MKDYLSLLQRNSNFRALWFASLVTMLGDWFNTIGTIVLINRYTDSGMAVAALFLARMVPPFLFGPVAGLVADRVNRKAIMIISDLLRVAIVLGFLLVDSAGEAWLVYLLTAAQFTISTFFQPASSALLPRLINNKQDLLLANTLGSVTWSAMLALGAALGGATTALFGVQIALIVDSITFAISALLIAFIRVPGIGVAAAEPVSDGRLAIAEGIRFAWRQPDIGAITLVKAMGHIGSLDVVMTTLAATLFVYGKDGAWSLGIMMTAAGFGAVAGPLLMNLVTTESDGALRRAIGHGFAALAVGWLIVGLSPVFGGVLLGIVLRAMGGSVNWTYSSALLQMNVPDRLLGRVFALDEMLRTLIASLGIWLAGIMMDTGGISIQSLASWYGWITMLIVIGWWWMLLRTEIPSLIAGERKLTA